MWSILLPTAILVLVYLVYYGGLVIYRLYFHPLAKFPGPKLAAMSSMYEFYHNVIKDGLFFREIGRMHDNYGPIVRITPDELHICDPYYYTQIYGGATKRREKNPKFTESFGKPLALGMTVDHNLHRSRRAILTNHFSKRSIGSIQPLIQFHANRLATRMVETYEKGEVLKLEDAYSAMSTDIISEFVYGVSFNYLDVPDFNNELRRAFTGMMSKLHLFRFMPFLHRIQNNIPLWVVQKLVPSTAGFIAMHEMVRELSLAAVNGKDDDRQGKNTVLRALCNPKIPAEERGLDRVSDESLGLLGGGTETTAQTLAIITFYLLNNKTVLTNLREELKQAPNATWSELENLPYMRAVINEGLRLTYGVISRLGRRMPDEALIYKDWVIPAGTVVSGTSYFMHMDPELFPNPHEFDPERWIRAQQSGQRLEPFLVNFTKGTRQCIGIHMAMAELYMIIAMVVRKFDMEPYETTRDDMLPYRDHLITSPKERKAGLQVLITKVLET